MAEPIYIHSTEDEDVEMTIYSHRPECALITLTQNLSRDGISPANSYSFRLHNVSAANLRSWVMTIITYLDVCADHFDTSDDGPDAYRPDTDYDEDVADGTVPDVDSKNSSDHE